MAGNNPNEAELMNEILNKTKAYSEAIKNNRPLSEAKQIRREIKKLTQELKELIAAKDSRPSHHE